MPIPTQGYHRRFLARVVSKNKGSLFLRLGEKGCLVLSADPISGQLLQHGVDHAGMRCFMINVHDQQLVDRLGFGKVVRFGDWLI